MIWISIGASATRTDVRGPARKAAPPRRSTSAWTGIGAAVLGLTAITTSRHSEIQIAPKPRSLM